MNWLLNLIETATDWLQDRISISHAEVLRHNERIEYLRYERERERKLREAMRAQGIE